MDKGFLVWMGAGVFNINDHVYTDNSSHYNNSRKRMFLVLVFRFMIGQNLRFIFAKEA